jgi:hypothetical protein
MSINHDMTPFLLLFSDRLTLLNAELNIKQPTKKLCYNLGNFNTRTNLMVRSLIFTLHNFSKFLEGQTLYIIF